MKTSVKKFSMFVLVFAIMAVCIISFSTTGIQALASSVVEVSGTIKYVSTESVIYDAKSHPLSDGYTAIFVSEDDISYNLVEGKDFSYKEDAKWEFKGVKESSESEWEELDLETNNFTFAGKYKIEVEIIGESFVSEKEEDESIKATFLEYTIEACDPTVTVASIYNAVVGMRLTQILFPLGWSIKTLPVEVEKEKILTTEDFSELPYTIIPVTLSFSPPEGTEDNFVLDQEIIEKSISIKILAKPEIVYKGAGTSETPMSPDLITYNEEDNKYTGSIMLNSFTKTGYKFRSFMIEGDDSGTEYSRQEDASEEYEEEFSLDPVARVVFIVQWDPRTDTKYTVEHYRQGLANPDSFQKRVNDTQVHEGTTEEVVTINVEEDEKHVWVMDGFTYSPTITEEKGFYSGKVLAEGSLVLKLYYERDYYGVEYVIDPEDTLITGELPIDEEKYKYEERFSLKNAEELDKPGWTFVGWTDGQSKAGKELTVFTTSQNYTMIAPKASNGDKLSTLTFTAKFVPNTNTPYVVKHILASDNSLLLEKELYGETDSEAYAMAILPGYKKLSGYADEHDLEYKENGIITADGGLVLAVYYELIDYEVSFMLGTTTLAPSETYNINDELELPLAPEKEGYVFSGWKINGVLYQPGDKIIILGDMRVEGVYATSSQEMPDENLNNNEVTIERDKKPLSGGGIAGIVISGVFVLSVSIFSVIWFGIKKKRLSDFAKLFEKKNR